MSLPPQRLRILRSLEVDEDNADYVKAKQQQQKKFKSRLESIFAKYESMHDSMSDIVDMHSAEILVDRGHLRRRARQIQPKGSLLDAMGMGTVTEADPVSEDEEREESEDELAPTQQPKPEKASTGSGKFGCKNVEAQSDERDERLAKTPADVTGPPIAQHVPHTPHPAANLLQHLQFPQTPAGQQAQTAFIANLTATINQAVAQAVRPLFSGLLPTAPGLLTISASPLPTYTTPTTASDTIVPATDPAWYFPPLVAYAKTHVAQSSPIRTPRTVKLSQSTARHSNSKQSATKKASLSEGLRAQGKAAMINQSADSQANTPSRQRSPRVEIQRRRGPPRRYHFTEQDDVLISQKKVLHNCTFLDIRNSRDVWKTWPLATFSAHWHRQLKGKNLHLQALADNAEDALRDSHQQSPNYSYHFPTPSSLNQEDPNAENVQSSKRHIPSSSASHFDRDEIDLLSLAGSQVDEEEQVAVGDDDIDEDTILPSVEDEITAKDTDDSHPHNDSVKEEKEVEPSPPAPLPTTAQSIPASRRKRSKRKRQQPTTRRDEIPDSEDLNDDLISSQHPKSSPTRKRPRPNSDSISLVGTSDLPLPPPTPTIKRERKSSTPLPPALVASTPAAHTPRNKSSNPFSVVHSSPAGPQSTGKLSRKAFLKQVKQSWTKGGATPAPKRKSLSALGSGKASAWGAGARAGPNAEESEDELAF